MRFGIASYQRPNCPTFSLLTKAGISPSDIIISVQDEKDYDEYKRRNPNANIIFQEKDCAAGNRNTILEMTNGGVWLLDDDITSFCILNQRKQFRVNNAAVVEFFESVAKFNKEKTIVGVAANANNMSVQRRPDYSWDTLLQGSILYVPTGEIRFNEEYKMVEDYEICLRCLAEGGSTLRVNYISANKPKNGTNAGGMHGRYEAGELKDWLKRLNKDYPAFRINTTFSGGQL